MNHMKREPRTGTGSRREWWPVLALLALTVIVPTGVVLWFMIQAMGSERLAVRQRLADAYRAQLVGVRSTLEAEWTARIETLAARDPNGAAQERFASTVREGLAGSIVLYDPGGRPEYPTTSRLFVDPAPVVSSGWSQAEELEHRLSDPAGAARAYRDIAGRTGNVHERGRALLARARCLAKVGDSDAAIDVLVVDLADPSFERAVDRQGRAIQPDALLRGLELMQGREHPARERTVVRLTRILDDYGADTLSASQRRFLMKRLREIVEPAPEFSTLEAEELAAAYTDRHSTMAETSFLSPFAIPESWLVESVEGPRPILRPSLIPRVWQLPFPDRRGVALFRQEQVLAEVERLCREQSLPREVSVAVLPPGTDAPQETFASVAVGRPLTGWRLGLTLENGGLFDETSNRQSLVYLWTAILFVTAILALTALVARYVERQIRVARIKNDLVATVTHELKTPLASIRLLVDTLLEGHYRDDEQKTREYLGMISRENARLSRLIDHFLTFSRMERNKRSFDVAKVDPGRIAREAAGAIGERYEAAGFELITEIPEGLPTVVADADAMETVLLNLLDNAMKYSGDSRRVTLRVAEWNGGIRFEVEDHGVGMSARTTRRVFDRFYQADHSLARRAGGCGLGLSIVKFVAEAHGGSVAVSSTPGKGSTFTVTLPAKDSRVAGRLLEEAR
jgi:signal transduction histidine kinase